MFSAGEEFTIEEIRFQMTGEHFYIAGRGDVYTAIIQSKTNRTDLGKLLEKQIKDGTITGVEAFATMHQNVGVRIGLLIRETK